MIIKKSCDIVKDLSVDWLQMIYQYYYADRKEKMQDYTPKSLALFMGKLAGEADKITDLCAGSGALTIQRWNMNHEQRFELYEFDENVIPFLLFNMAVRNIECTVYHSDVLQQEVSICSQKEVRMGLTTQVSLEITLQSTAEILSRQDIPPRSIFSCWKMEQRVELITSIK